MSPNALARDILAARPLPPGQAEAALAQARTLQDGVASAALRAGLLQGRRLGLMGLSADSEDAQLFRRAASALGAQVSFIPALLGAGSSFREIDATAQLLGRLYDAVECQGMDLAVVRRLGAAAAIPVYPGLASRGHPCSELARELPGDAGPAEKRAWLLQALLLRSID